MSNTERFYNALFAGTINKAFRALFPPPNYKETLEMLETLPGAKKIWEKIQNPVDQAEQWVATQQEKARGEISKIIENMNSIHKCQVMYDNRVNTYGTCAPFSTVFSCLRPFRNGIFCVMRDRASFNTFKNAFEDWLSGIPTRKMHTVYDRDNKRWLETDEAKAVYNRIGPYCDAIFAAITAIDNCSKQLESPEFREILEKQFLREEANQKDLVEKEELLEEIRHGRLVVVSIKLIKKHWPHEWEQKARQFENFIDIAYDDNYEYQSTSMGMKS